MHSAQSIAEVQYRRAPKRLFKKVPPPSSIFTSKLRAKIAKATNQRPLKDPVLVEKMMYQPANLMYVTKHDDSQVKTFYFQHKNSTGIIEASPGELPQKQTVSHNTKQLFFATAQQRRSFVEVMNDSKATTATDLQLLRETCPFDTAKLAKGSYVLEVYVSDDDQITGWHASRGALIDTSETEFIKKQSKSLDQLLLDASQPQSSSGRLAPVQQTSVEEEITRL